MESVSDGNDPKLLEKVRVDELYDDLLQDYRIHGKDEEWAKGRWDVHLKDYFGGMKASRVGTAQIAEYVEKRQSEKAAEATVNRELALLRRAFSLGFEAEPQKVSHVPKFHKYIVSEKGNERKGFIEEPQYRKLAEHASELWLRGLLALAYNYGFRKSNLLEMRCSQVDLRNNTVCLYAGETKNEEPLIVGLTTECRELLTELKRDKQPEDYLLTRANGEPVRDLRGTWDALTKAAGLPGLLLHDFRRSAVRNMIRRGVPQKTAMKVSGHKTDAVFSRYNIVSEADIRDAVRKIEQGAKAEIQSSFTVAQECSNSEEAAESEEARKPS